MNGRRFARIPLVLLLLAALTMGAGTAPPGLGAAPVCSPWGGAASFSASGEPDEAGFYLVKEEAEATYTFAGLSPGAADLYLQLELRAAEGASAQVWFGAEERPFLFAPGAGQPGRTAILWFNPSPYTADGFLALSTPDIGMDGTVIISMRPAWEPLPTASAGVRAERAVVLPAGNTAGGFRGPTPGETSPGVTLLTMQAGHPLVYRNREPVMLDVAPFITEGRTMLPFRFLAESLGAEVEWDEAAQRVTFWRERTTVQLVIVSREARVGQRTVMLDVPPMLRDNRTFVPVRFIAEALGAQVGYSPRAGRSRCGHRQEPRSHLFADSPALGCPGRALFFRPSGEGDCTLFHNLNQTLTQIHITLMGLRHNEGESVPRVRCENPPLEEEPLWNRHLSSAWSFCSLCSSN